jgi:DNA-binding NarL/FixJ family response regulator
MKEKLSILIVDDNMHFVKRMTAILKEIDDICFIHTAHHSEEAFGLLDKRPDLVLLDIHLPGKNGMDLLKRIKDSAKNCEVIMLSNYAGEYYRQQCKKLGAMHFLDKTNEFELLPSLIKEFAAQNRHKFSGCDRGMIAVNN